MKKKLLAGLALTLLITTTVSSAYADTIVDTGPGLGTSFNWTLSNETPGVTDQWLAAEFTLTQDYYITDLFGWLHNNGQTGNKFTITIYGDGGDIPDSGNLIYSNSAIVAGTEGQANWEGYHISYGNGLELAQGTYWIAYEIRPNNYANHYTGFMPSPSTSPLVNEAFINSSGWIGYDDLNLGVKILGTPNAPVPEPTTMLLMGTGLAGLIGARRKKNA